MPDHVPDGFTQLAQGRALGFAFLHAIFAEVAHAQPVGLTNGFRGYGFRDRDQRDRRGRATRAMGRRRDPRANALEGNSQRRSGAAHGAIVASSDRTRPAMFAGAGSRGYTDRQRRCSPGADW